MCTRNITFTFAKGNTQLAIVHISRWHIHVISIYETRWHYVYRNTCIRICASYCLNSTIQGCLPFTSRLPTHGNISFRHHHHHNHRHNTEAKMQKAQARTACVGVYIGSWGMCAHKRSSPVAPSHMSCLLDFNIKQSVLKTQSWVYMDTSTML
jgi:hypothetical protein